MLKNLSEYNIKFEGLKQGIHFYEFNVDNTFFEEFDCFEYKDSAIAVGLEFEKQSTIMVLTFDFLGAVTVPCDRCLDDVEVEIGGEEKLVVKFGNEEYDDTDEIKLKRRTIFILSMQNRCFEGVFGGLRECNCPQPTEAESK